MSARELHRYVRDSGKRRPNFRDIKPFVDEKRYSLIHPARALVYGIAQKRKNGEKIPDKQLQILALLKQAGILVHPLNFEVCVALETESLKIQGIPFEVFYHLLPGKGFVGGTFMDTGDKRSSSVFISLTVAMHLLSSYLANNNLGSLGIQRIGSRFLMDKYKENSLANLPQDKVMEMMHHFLGTRLFEAQINAIYDGESVASYMNIIEKILNGIAMHEAAHVLHKETGILGVGGIEKEEERAYLTELVYGNSGLVFPYLPTRKKDDPNCVAGRRIIEMLYLRNDFSYLMRANRAQLSAMAKELLDEEFMMSFGAHHDEIIPRIEIERVRQHRFFSDEHLPLIENIRYFPKKRAA
jgi:hypothetical protein